MFSGMHRKNTCSCGAQRDKRGTFFCGKQAMLRTETSPIRFESLYSDKGIRPVKAETDKSLGVSCI